LTALSQSASVRKIKAEEQMITETMVLVALRQRNWLQAGSMAREIASERSLDEMKAISRVSDMAQSRPDAAYLLSLWAGIRWGEINDDEDI